MTKRHSVPNAHGANSVLEKEAKAQKLKNLSYIPQFTDDTRRNHTQQLPQAVLSLNPLNP